MIRTKQSSGLYGVILPVFLMLMFSSCASHIEKGWGHFSKDKYSEARAEWAQSKTPILTEKIDVTEMMVSRHNEAEALDAADQKVKSTKVRIDLLSLDRWPSEKWIDKSPGLKMIVLKAKTQVESERKRVQGAYDNFKACGDKHYQAQKFADAEQCYGKAVRTSKIYKRIGLKTSPQVKYNLAISCGKDKYEKDEWPAAKKCFQLADKIGKANPKSIKAEDTESMIGAVDQAVEIARQMELERKRAIEAQIRHEAEQKRIMEEKIRLAELQRKAAELARLKAEKERQRKEALRKKRWMDFLAKGTPLKPLVAVVGIPSKGEGTLAKKKATKKFQGSARFPAVKRKKMRVEDLYALEIVIPSTYRLTYLRNYHKKKGNMLKMPQNLGGKKHYYTEGYKGGRFYTQIQNAKGKQSKYTIKAVIYKIPVIH